MTSLHVTVDADQTSVAQAIESAADTGVLVILTSRMFRELAHELGSDDAAMWHLLTVSERVNKPVGCNFPTADGSRTAFIAPATWSQARLRG